MAQNIRLSFKGRLTREPIVSKTGKYILNIACNQFQGSDKGEFVMYISLLGVTEGLAKLLCKGQMVVVQNSPIVEPQIYKDQVQLSCILDAGSDVTPGMKPREQERDEQYEAEPF